MAYDIKSVLEMVHNIRTMNVGGIKSPHKYLLLIAIAGMYAKEAKRPNIFPLNQELENEFLRTYKELYPNSDSENILIEYPFYHLVKDNVWQLVLKKGKEDIFRKYETMRLTRNRLLETTDHGSLIDKFDICFRDPSCRTRIIEEIKLLLKAIQNPPFQQRKKTFSRLDLSDASSVSMNPFVGYLNSLQRINASNENALAEYQSCNPFFSLIQIEHPLTKTIRDELINPNGRQIILTGHAGDGKSTIALDVYKYFAKNPIDQPLKRQINPRENLPGTNISILKDLSERNRKEDAELVKEFLERKRRFLIVSNTGTLIDLFRAQEEAFKRDSSDIESDVLVAISNEQGNAELTLGGTRFLVLNLARIDNLVLAQKIFERMIDPMRWTTCASLACRENCPIYLNVDLIYRRREVVLNRLFLAYRRMYEYGTRLTLRQLTEHLSYIITSGLDESDLANMRVSGVSPLRAEFMFFNRFFGDDGKKLHLAADKMRAIREVRRQGFGEQPCPTWERKLWLKLRDRNFQLGVEDCEKEFGLLRDHGSGPGNDNQPGLSPDQARDQVRRMLYFLYDFQKEDQRYLVQFLNSPNILRWQNWQKTDVELEMTERTVLEQRIYHVLQEHFTGVRLPEGARGNDRRLYITLNRGNNEIRQSAQVVIAQVDWSNETNLELISKLNAAAGIRKDLQLIGSGRIKGADLVLTLPFLDYVLMRHLGEVGETLQAAYVERLERFKAKVQDLAKETRTHVMLVRLKTDHTFRRQQYTVKDGNLEVIDVL